MDVGLRELAEQQADLVARWQLRGLGWSDRQVDDWAWRRRWRAVYPGVYVMARAPLTRRQRWIAATLSAPGSVLSHASAAACWGFRDWEGRFETIVRPGSGGPRRMGSLLVSRSTTLAGCTTSHEGIAITTSARTLIDLAHHLRKYELARGFRESARLGLHTVNDLALVLRDHRGRRGTAFLRDLCDRYATIPYHRCRSDAECRALEILHESDVPSPQVNVNVAGREADLVWRDRLLIVEIDGPDWHRFADQDAIKEARWRSAGYTIRRVPSDDIYFRPARLLQAARSQS